MKTSFYLVIWTIIQFGLLIFIPTLSHVLIRPFIAQIEFEIACAMILCVYWILDNNPSSKEYLCCVNKIRQFDDEMSAKFKNRLLLSYIFNTIIIVFFIASAILIARILIHTQVATDVWGGTNWWGRTDWIGLIVFVLFTCRIIIQCINKLHSLKRSNQISVTKDANKEKLKVIISLINPRKFKLYQRL